MLLVIHRNQKPKYRNSFNMNNKYWLEISSKKLWRKKSVYNFEIQFHTFVKIVKILVGKFWSTFTLLKMLVLVNILLHPGRKYEEISWVCVLCLFLECRWCILNSFLNFREIKTQFLSSFFYLMKATLSQTLFFGSLLFFSFFLIFSLMKSPFPPFFTAPTSVLFFICISW